MPGRKVVKDIKRDVDGNILSITETNIGDEETSLDKQSLALSATSLAFASKQQQEWLQARRGDLIEFQEKLQAHAESLEESRKQLLAAEETLNRRALDLEAREKAVKEKDAKLAQDFLQFCEQQEERVQVQLLEGHRLIAAQVRRPSQEYSSTLSEVSAESAGIAYMCEKRGIKCEIDVTLTSVEIDPDISMYDALLITLSGPIARSRLAEPNQDVFFAHQTSDGEEYGHLSADEYDLLTDIVQGRTELGKNARNALLTDQTLFAFEAGAMSPDQYFVHRTRQAIQQVRGILFEDFEKLVLKDWELYLSGGGEEESPGLSERIKSLQKRLAKKGEVAS